jgi:predicted amidohydrolase YtcJ
VNNRDWKSLPRLVPLLLALLGGCADPPEPARESVDLLLHNGVVLALDQASTRGTALAVREGKIVAIGDERLLDRFDAASAVDLAGRTVMPGFVDSHTHVAGYAPRHVDLTTVHSIRELRERIAAKAAELGPDQWITGYGWSEDSLEEHRRPLRQDLDQAAPDNPVVLTRAGSHSVVASSRALALAKIDERTPQPEGGVIETDNKGKLNGIIRERVDLVLRLVPSASDEELRPSLVANLQAQFAYGITSIVQGADTIAHYPEWERVYAEHPGQLPRASVNVAWAGDAAMQAFGRRTGDGDEWLRVGAVKLFVDGGFTGPAAYTREPYRGMGDYRGVLTLPPETLHGTIRAAHRAGWQLSIHAIGDAAIDLAVEALVDVLAETPRADHRHYLNHFTLLPGTATLGEMADNGVAITTQPNFLRTLEGRYVEYLDGTRLETNNAVRTPLNHGIRVALSSDVLPVGPFVGIQAAVTRAGASGRVFGPAERITVLEALRAYTATGAWLTHEEGLKGTLEPGKLADFIVLSQNPLEAGEDRVLATQVLETWLGGARVWSMTD